ncbi:hypothetical protein Srufu_012900 [Streptomyces libani subsp. rufus]|nr:hypothetical protein Srufu_012900 [Streptomyces libani subsp. rufus]
MFEGGAGGWDGLSRSIRAYLIRTEKVWLIPRPCGTSLPEMPSVGGLLPRVGSGPLPPPAHLWEETPV